jgi:hypothetical protein
LRFSQDMPICLQFFNGFPEAVLRLFTTLNIKACAVPLNARTVRIALSYFSDEASNETHRQLDEPWLPLPVDFLWQWILSTSRRALRCRPDERMSSIPTRGALPLVFRRIRTIFD